MRRRRGIVWKPGLEVKEMGVRIRPQSDAFIGARRSHQVRCRVMIEALDAPTPAVSKSRYFIYL
jgi:hypothetical protein